MSEQLRREGDNLQRLLNDVRDEFGPTVRILSASKTRVGGVLGFFASQRYVVLAQVPERPAAIDNVEDPMALASQIFHVVEETAVPEPPARVEQATPEQAFAAALVRAVARQTSQGSLAEVNLPAAPTEVIPKLTAAPA